jgi:hypothetical protein
MRACCEEVVVGREDEKREKRIKKLAEDTGLIGPI